MSYDALVIGAGAAGLLAAAVAAERGKRTLLLEKNRRAGVKILISGGTRCNLTHATDHWGIVKAYRQQGNFLHSALAALGPADLVKVIEDEGVATKVEETGKVFPISNRATDVLDALLRRLHKSGAELALEEPVIAIGGQANAFLVQTSKREIPAKRVLITVGGQSYPGSGTTGDGYSWAAKFGHTIVPPRPALVPLMTDAAWVRALSGITVPDVALAVKVGDSLRESPALGLTPTRGAGDSRSESPTFGKSKPLDERRGSLLFTHFGLSGPVVLDISRTVTAASDPAQLVLHADFLPNQRRDAVDADLRTAAAREGKRQLAGLIAPELPRRLIEQLALLAGLPPDLKAAELTKKGRGDLTQLLKGTPIPISGTRGFAKAEVTAGGVALSEVDSRTLQSKLVPGLYFAGEILDLDGPIGGYNFQAAFSTGYLAGLSV